MSGAVAETPVPEKACAQCGYDLSGLATADAAPTCPECGALAGSWRSAYPAPWLIVPALRLLSWAIPVLVTIVCVARFVDASRGLHRGLILSPDAVLLYAVPLGVCVAGVVLVGAASPTGKRARAGVISLGALSIGCVGVMVMNYGQIYEYSSGLGAARAVSHTLNLSLASLAARTTIVAAAALGVVCIAVLGRLGAELGWSWFAARRSLLTASVAGALAVGLVLRQIVQAAVVAGVQGTAVVSYPVTPPPCWMDPVLLGMGAVVLGLVWSLAFAALARIRSMDSMSAGGRGQ